MDIVKFFNKKVVDIARYEKISQKKHQ